MSKKKLKEKMIKTSIDLTADHYHFLKMKALERKMRGKDPSFVTIIRELIELDRKKLGLVVYLVSFIFLFSSMAQASSDIQAQLSDSSGATGFSVQNNAPTPAEVARIDSNGNLTTHGNVGVGTSSTQTLLDVQTGLATPLYAGAGDAFIENNLEVQGITHLGNLIATESVFNGNIGINSTNPGQALDVNGQVRTKEFDMSGEGPAIGYVLTSMDSSGDATWSTQGVVSGWTVSGNNVYETSGGNVGIGSTLPGQALDVQGGARTVNFTMSGEGPAIGYVLTSMDSSGDATWSTQGVVAGWTLAGNNVYETSGGNVGIGTIFTNGGAALTVMNGNVGIGTWGPSAPLTVGTNAFTVNMAGAITATTGITTSGAYTQNSGGVNSFSNNIGIGSTLPGQALDVNGVARTVGFTMSGSVPAVGYVLTSMDSSGDATWSTQGVVAGWTTSGANVYETSSGNVGIGTTFTNAGAALSVMNGNVGIGTWAPSAPLTVGTNAFMVNTAGAITAMTGITTSGGYAQSGPNINSFSGNVGVGSTLPGQTLDVNGTVRTGGFTMNNYSPGSGYVLTSMDSSGDATWSTQGVVAGWTTSGANVYETSGGNVGIGTTTPQSALVVTNGNVGIGTWTAAGGNLIVNGGGNVGINSAWPGMALDVNGTVRSIGFITTGGYTQSGLAANTFTGTPTFSNATNSALFTGGNVGVGSTLPGQTLDVNGTVRTAGFAMTGQAPAGGYVLTSMDSSGDATWSTQGVVAGWTTSGANVYETSGGNVGIGTTTPQGALVVTNGNVGIGTWTAAGGNLIVNGGGNVGINSAWPGMALDVNGTVRSIGFITTGGYTQSGLAANTFTGTPTFSNATNSALFTGGNVGVGSTLPGQTLDVNGTVRTGGFTMNNYSPGSGYVLTSMDSSGDATWSTQGVVAGWTTSGANVYETSGGNVGIGTTTPQSALVVTNGNVGIGTWTAAGGNLIVNGGGNVGINSAWPGMALDVNGTVRSIGFITTGGYTQSGLAANTFTGTPTFSNATNSALFTGGNVGVGSTLPGQALDVNGTVRSIGFITTGGYTQSGLAANTFTGTPTFSNATNSALFTGGNVGVGSTLPGQALDVNGTVRSIGFITTGGYTQSGLAANTFTGTPTFSNATNSALFTGGNVGVGSANPGQTLDVNGTVRTGGFTMNNYSPGSGYVLTSMDSSGDATWSTQGVVAGWTTSGANVYETSGGNVGIGTTTPQSALVVTNGNVGIGTWTAAGGNLIVNGGGNVGINSAWPGQALDINGTVRNIGEIVNGNVGIGTSTPQGALVVTNGNVGIGTWVPAYMLDVQGNVNSTTSFSTSGNAQVGPGAIVYMSFAAGDRISTAGTLFRSGATMDWSSQSNGVGGAVDTRMSRPSAGVVQLTNPNIAGALGEVTAGNVGIGTGLSSSFILNSAPNGGMIVEGNVGVGSLTPGQKLDVTGTMRTVGFTMSGQVPAIGYVLTSMDSSGDATWSTQGVVAGWTTSGANVYETSGGNVGIGTTTPQSALVVTNGNVGIGTWTAAGGNLIVNGGGNVGIGSAWPGQKLDVAGTIRTMGFVMSGSNPANGYVLAALDNSGTATWSSVAAISGWTTSGANVYETSGGNVGIGTTTPQGALVVTNGNVGIGTWTAAGGNLIVNGGGNVGINSAWPGMALDVNGTVRSIGFITTGGYTQSGLAADTFTGTPTFSNATNSALFTGGNVGVGSTLPGQALDVNGTVRTGGFTMNNYSPGSGYVLTSMDSSGDATWSTQGVVAGWTTSGANVYETSGGNVGIGTTTPQSALVVTNGNVGIGTWTAAGGNLIVNGGGNVGIGSAWPGSQLDVNGTIRVFGYVGINNSSPQVPFQVGPPQIFSGTLSNYTEGIAAAGVNDINLTAGTGFYLQTDYNIGSSGRVANTQVTTNGFYFETDTATGRFEVNSNVGIGSSAPGAALDVNGTVRTGGFTMNNYSPGSGYVLTSMDSSGDATWSTQGVVAGWTTSGANVYETSGGNVGIGTTTPQSALVVTNGNVGIGTWTAAGGNLIVNGGGNVGIDSAWPGMALDVNGTVRSIGFITTGGYTQSGLAANTFTGTPTFSNATNSALFTGGNVGVGSTLPGQALDVNGTVRSIGFITTGGYTQSGLAANTFTGTPTFSNATNSALFTGGNVGVGSTLPGQALDVNGTVRSIGFITTGGYTQSGLAANTFTGTPTFSNATNSALFTGGNVGVGSTLPGQTLDVNGTVRTGGFTMNNYSPGSGYVLTSMDSSGDATWSTQGVVAGWTTSGANVYETSGGNVGIGTTTPQGALVVTNGNVGIGTWSPAQELQVNGTVNSFVVTSGGNVGIGTWVPAQALDIENGYISVNPVNASGIAGSTEFMMENSSGAGIGSASGGIGRGSVVLFSNATLSDAAAINGAFFQVGSGMGIGWTTSTATAANPDTGFARQAAAQIVATDGGVGIGTFYAGGIGIGTNRSSAYLQTAIPVGGMIVQGNVGIGSTTPGQLLDVTGTIRTVGFTMNNYSPGSGYVLTSMDSSGDATWSTQGVVAGWTTSGANVYETSGGNVGIGTTTPQSALVVTNGNVGIGTWTAAGGNLIVNGGGNVGINSAWPGQALDINGTVRNIGEIINGNVGIGTSTPQGALVVTNGNVGIGTWAPSSTFNIIGSIASAVTSQSSTYTAAATDHIILVSGNFTVTLPPAASVTGREYIIKKTDASSNVVTIKGNAAETIDGQNTVSITVQYQSYTVISDGSGWDII